LNASLNIADVFIEAPSHCNPARIAEKTMKSARYNEIVDYLLNDVLPDEFDSTPSNFRREAANYALDEKARLYRNNKPVVKWGERKEIYEAFHSHQGR